MAVLKCKMCGGSMTLNEGVMIAECDYCGTMQTVPLANDEKKMTLFARANRLRFMCEFDKATGVYEAIVAEFPEEAEAYWGLVLCKYGIEYVDDSATAKKIPTCHRSSFDSVFDDSNFEQALENADISARTIYREEAKQIEQLRKGIVEVSSREEPYDIFICYKETADDGDRTIDSVIAQDVYNALVEKGYRVFFSRISLEDKLGTEYEPYIFAALNSAKIMLAFGTSYEYYNAVWVKNEWSRFLQLIAKGEKKTLIPCYKNIDAYDMPKEFAKLQAQDMGKVGALQDLLRGIEKIMPKAGAEKETVVVQQTTPQSATTESLLKRVQLFLDDGDFNGASEYCNKVLDIDPENAEAYVGLLMCDLKLRNENEFDTYDVDFSENRNYTKAVRFAAPERKAVLEQYHKNAEEKRLEEERIAEEKRLEAERIEKERLLHLKEKRKTAEKFSKFVACDSYHTVGLKSDGTVVALGDNYEGQCNVSDWKDIVAIACYSNYTVGLKSDGTVVAVGDNKDGRCKVSDWKDIVTIACGSNYTVGLKSDGTVVAVGGNVNGQCNVSDWKDIVAIACGDYYTVGLKSDGTVVAVGDNKDGRCNVSDWKDIVAIACGYLQTVGLKSDGTVVAVGHNSDGQCNVSGWKLFDDFNNIDEEQKVKREERRIEEEQKLRRKEEELRRKEEERRARRARGVCQHCGGSFKGLFTKKCANCGKEKDY